MNNSKRTEFRGVQFPWFLAITVVKNFETIWHEILETFKPRYIENVIGLE